MTSDLILMSVFIVVSCLLYGSAFIFWEIDSNRETELKKRR